MGKAKRKQRPEPPKYFDYATDNCYKCKHHNGCGGCKVLKEYIAINQKNLTKFKNYGIIKI